MTLKRWFEQVNWFVAFYWKAATYYQVHSPFLFEFVKTVLEDDRQFYAFAEIEFFRKGLLQSDRQIAASTFGAGSTSAYGKKTIPIAHIASNITVPPRLGKILFRIAHFLKPKTMLELGTSLGISSLYIKSGYRDGELITIEGSKAISDLAKEHFAKMDFPDIRLLNGSFTDMLPIVLPEYSQLDLIFIDGDHSYESTLRLFEQCLNCIHSKTVIIFDDINWSEGMRRAWKEVKRHPKTKATVNLYNFGIVFFREEFKEPVHHNLVPLNWKPWKKLVI